MLTTARLNGYIYIGLATTAVTGTSPESSTVLGYGGLRPVYSRVLAPQWLADFGYGCPVIRTTAHRHVSESTLTRQRHVYDDLTILDRSLRTNSPQPRRPRPRNNVQFARIFSHGQFRLITHSHKDHYALRRIAQCPRTIRGNKT